MSITQDCEIGITSKGTNGLNCLVHLILSSHADERTEDVLKETFNRSTAVIVLHNGLEQPGRKQDTLAKD